MDNRKSRPGIALGLALLMILASLVTQPAPVEAQCTVVGSTAFVTSMTNVVYVTLNASYSCMVVMMMNVSACGFVGTDTMRAMFTASAMTTYTNPSCSWSCTGGACGSIVADSTNGLPVELMDFEVEDDESSESAEDEDADSSAD